MIIDGFKYFPFSLKLKKPFFTSSKRIDSRTGFIISLTDELNNSSFGECSPLPGFSAESLEDAEKNLIELKSSLVGIKFENNLGTVDTALREIPMLPSLRFAAEQAFVNLLLMRDGDIKTGQGIQPAKTIPVNAVSGIDSAEAVLKNIRNKIEDGFSVFKIKVGRENVYDDFILIEKIRNEFGDKIIIRLDANRAWSADEALEYLKNLASFNIEYAEEPCEHVCSNFRLIEESPIPIALDESLISFDNAEEIIDGCNAEYIVLKPMVLGGVLRTLDLIKKAEEKNKKIIISSSFESAVGKSALVLLAASVNHSLAHGLDTTGLFENNLCTDPFPVSSGRIEFDLINYPPNFNLAQV